VVSTESEHFRTPDLVIRFGKMIGLGFNSPLSGAEHVGSSGVELSRALCIRLARHYHKESDTQEN
jgi:hypothetical protein